uniref:MADF domain-containing protein n=1 Tax=Knipowitschia caucasica TaxID=637954 RepID=A0AAV2MCY1_KNICA
MELSVQDGCVLWGSRVVVPPPGDNAADPQDVRLCPHDLSSKDEPPTQPNLRTFPSSSIGGKDRRFSAHCYRDRNKKELAWRRVSEVVGVSVEVCKKRWKNLRDTYAKESRKEKEKVKKSDPHSQIHEAPVDRYLLQRGVLSGGGKEGVVQGAGPELLTSTRASPPRSVAEDIDVQLLLSD